MPWRLVFVHLRKSWFRTTLTAAGVALAIFLLCALRTVITGLQSVVKESNAHRLIVTSALGLFKTQPVRLEQELRSMAGVRDVTHWTWFGGVYIDQSNMFSRFATDPETLRRVYGAGARPDIAMPAAQWEAFGSERTACIVGKALADKYGWKLGDKIEMTGNIYPGQYTFTVRGIYTKGRDAIDDAMLFFHWKYMYEMLRASPGGAEHSAEVSIYVIETDTGADMGSVAHDVDDRFGSSDHATKTMTEAAFNQQFVSMWGNIPLLLSMIGGAVLFAAFMIALNTMLLAGRERRLEFAVLKSLGFGDGVVAALLICEGTAVCGLGGMLGVIGAKLTFDIRKIEVLERMFPGFHILPETALLAVAVAAAVGLVSGIVPALVAARTSVVAGLSRRA
jgi:putative ABC transport system permease protein